MSHSNIWRVDVCLELIFDSIKVFFTILFLCSMLKVLAQVLSPGLTNKIKIEIRTIFLSTQLHESSI